MVTVALNILYGAAVLSCARMLRAQGVTLAPGMPRLASLDRGDIEKRCRLLTIVSLARTLTSQGPSRLPLPAVTLEREMT